MRTRRLLVLLAAAMLAGGLFLAAAPAATAQEPTTTVVPLPPPEQQKPSIIPLPNSGREPVVEGDPGSGAQYAVLFGTMGGMVVIALLIARESRKNRALRTPKPADVAPAPAEVDEPTSVGG